MAFVLNPYLGDVNPGTPEGLKLYNKAIEAPDTKLNIGQKNSRDIVSSFEKDASDFGWGPAISAIQVNDNPAPDFKSILTKAREINLEHVQKAARRTWGQLAGLQWNDPLPNDLTIFDIDPAINVAQRPQFFRRTRSIMIAKRIEASLDKASLKSLMLEKKAFTWTEANGTIHYDGPTMLWLILSKINPSVRVGISTLKTNLSSATMPAHKHNIIQLLDYMHDNYTKIYEDDGEHTDYTLNLFNALETSNNQEFLTFLSGLKDEWETSNTDESDRETSDALRKKVLQKYNNMSKAKRWKKTDDPSSKIISALMTKVSSLENQISNSNKTNNQANATSSSGKAKLHIPEWRTVKKGESIEKEGNTWYWCPHHKKEGLFDGLYMPHKASEHDEWAKKKKEKAEKRKASKSGDEPKSKLQLTESMRNALVTDGNMTKEQASELIEKMMGK